MKARLERFINHPATEVSIGVLIVVSIVLLILEVAAPTASAWREWYVDAGAALTALFVVELALRGWVARNRRQFLRQYWLDIIAVLPALRAFRLLRVLRLLRLVRLGLLVSRRSRKVSVTFGEGLAENLLIGVLLLVVFLIGAVGILVAEGRGGELHGFGDAAWWSLCTLMSGQPLFAMPATGLGRAIAAVVMLGGITAFAVFTGVVSAVMVTRLRRGLEAKEFEIEDLDGHFVIGGWNRAGLTLVGELQADPQTQATPIVILAELEQAPSFRGLEINPGLIFFVHGDCTSTEALRRVHAERARRVILLADKSLPRQDQDRDARTVLAALTIERLAAADPAGPAAPGGAQTCVELLRRDGHKVQVLTLAGVEEIVEGDEYVGNLIAQNVRAGGLIQILDELLTSGRGNQFRRLAVAGDLAGCTFLEAGTRLKTTADAIPLGVCSRPPPGGGPPPAVRLNPPADYALQAGDELVVIAAAGPRRAALVPRRLAADSGPLPLAAPPAGALRLETVAGHCLICGWNRAAPRLIRQLRQHPDTRHLPVVVVAELPAAPPELAAAPELTLFVSGDYTATTVLDQVRVAAARTAILLADKTHPRSDQDRDARTILAALTIAKINPDVPIAVELLARSPEKLQALALAHVDDVVVGDAYLGNLMAQASRVPGLIPLLDELLSAGPANSLVKIPVPAALAGQDWCAATTWAKANLDAVLLAAELRRLPAAYAGAAAPTAAGRERYYVVNPPASCVLEPGDELFVIARQPRA